MFDARLMDFTLQEEEGGDYGHELNLPTIVNDILDCVHTIVTNGIVCKVQFFELFGYKVKGKSVLLFLSGER